MISERRLYQSIAVKTPTKKDMSTTFCQKIPSQRAFGPTLSGRQMVASHPSYATPEKNLLNAIDEYSTNEFEGKVHRRGLNALVSEFVKRDDIIASRG